jgi:hypothetical protein
MYARVFLGGEGLCCACVLLSQSSRQVGALVGLKLLPFYWFVQGMDVWLITDGSGEGRGGGEKKDVLPPLMPGLPARNQ